MCTSVVQEHQQLHGKSSYFSSAQLTSQHAKEEVEGQTVLVVANFPRKQIGPRMSDCLMTGVQEASDDAAARRDSTVLVTCSHDVEPGTLVTLTGVHHVESVMRAGVNKNVTAQHLLNRKQLDADVARACPAHVLRTHVLPGKCHRSATDATTMGHYIQ